MGTQPQRKILLVLVYRPPRGNSNSACSKIKKYLGDVHDYHKMEIILLGDFNWNVKVEHSTGLDCVMEIATEFGLEQLISCATRIGPNSETVIDLIFSNVANVHSAGCLDTTFSDHYPTYIVKKRIKLNLEKVEIRKRKMSSYDAETFGMKLKDLDWSILGLLNNVNDMWNMIYLALIYELDSMCPYTYIKVRKNAPVWFNKQLVGIARDRDRLLNKYRRGKRKNQNLYVEAVKKRREFNALVKKAKKGLFCGEISQTWQQSSNILEKHARITWE